MDELTDRTTRIFSRTQQHRPVTPTAIIRSQANVRSEDSTRFSEEVFEVLPSHSVWELRDGVGVRRCECNVQGGREDTDIADEELGTSVPRRRWRSGGGGHLDYGFDLLVRRRCKLFRGGWARGGLVR